MIRVFSRQIKSPIVFRKTLLKKNIGGTETMEKISTIISVRSCKDQMVSGR